MAAAIVDMNQKIISMNLDTLDEQRGQMHCAVDQYVEKVIDAGMQWITRNTRNHSTFLEIQNITSKAIAFLSLKCDEMKSELESETSDLIGRDEFTQQCKSPQMDSACKPATTYGKGKEDDTVDDLNLESDQQTRYQDVYNQLKSVLAKQDELEQQLNMKLNNLREDTESLKSDVGTVNQYVETGKTLLEDYSQKLESLENTVFCLSANVNEICSDQQVPGDRINSHLSAKDNQVITDLSAKVDQLTTDLTDKVNQVNKDLSENVAQVNKGLSTKVDQVNKGLSANVAQVKDLSAKVDQVKDLSAKFDKINKDLSANVAQINKGRSADIVQINKDLSAKFDQVNKDLSAKVDHVNKGLSANIAQVKDLSIKVDQVNKNLSADVDQTNKGLLANVAQAKDLSAKVDQVNNVLSANVAQAKDLSAKVDHVNNDLLADFNKVNKSLSANVAHVKDLSTKVDQVNKELSAKVDLVTKDLSANVAQINKGRSANFAEINKYLSANIGHVNTIISAKIDQVNKHLSAKVDQINVVLPSLILSGKEQSAQMNKIIELKNHFNKIEKDTQNNDKQVQQRLNEVGKHLLDVTKNLTDVSVTVAAMCAKKSDLEAVGFSAARNCKYGHGVVDKFEHPGYIAGCQFNSDTGIFTASSEGIYLAYVSLYLPTDCYSLVYLIRRYTEMREDIGQYETETPICTVQAKRKISTACCLDIIKMGAGDKLFIRTSEHPVVNCWIQFLCLRIG